MSDETLKENKPTEGRGEASELSAVLSADQLVTPGYYWWLPSFLNYDSDSAESWQVIAWHPNQETRQKSGEFIGPLVAPTFSR